MAIKKSELIIQAIEKLIQIDSEITIKEIAHKSNLSIAKEGDRKAIQRALNIFLKNGQIIPKGQGRARAYVQTNAVNLGAKTKNTHFKKIPISIASKNLIEYLSRPLVQRKPVGYQFDFLKSYRPNKTFYLNTKIRNDLFELGHVENKIKPAGTYARNILNRILIDLSWNSSRLEGNTYSLLETQRLIEMGQPTEGKNTTETQMIINHKSAIEYIVESASDPEITAHDIFSIHALLAENLLGDPSSTGKIRDISVGIKGSAYTPIDNPFILKEYFLLFVKKLNLIKDPFEQSLFSLVHLSYLQTFEDVNKRTARLVANIPLIKKNLRPLSFLDVEQKDYTQSILGIYEKNDLSLILDLYIWAYKRSSQHYSAVQQTLVEPNILKLKFRKNIHEIVRNIVLTNFHNKKLTDQIKKSIQILNLSKEDFLELFKIIETEIISLHEGNIARYKIRPSEFQKWKVTK